MSSEPFDHESHQSQYTNTVMLNIIPYIDKLRCSKISKIVPTWSPQTWFLVVPDIPYTLTLPAHQSFYPRSYSLVPVCGTTRTSNNPIRFHSFLCHMTMQYPWNSVYHETHIAPMLLAPTHNSSRILLDKFLTGVPNIS